MPLCPCSCRPYVSPFHTAYSPVADDPFVCPCSCRMWVFSFHTAYFSIADNPLRVRAHVVCAYFLFTRRTSSSLTVHLCIRAPQNVHISVLHQCDTPLSLTMSSCVRALAGRACFRFTWHTSLLLTTPLCTLTLAVCAYSHSTQHIPSPLTIPLCIRAHAGCACFVPYFPVADDTFVCPYYYRPCVFPFHTAYFFVAEDPVVHPCSCRLCVLCPK
jgi:hypothetical protein